MSASGFGIEWRMARSSAGMKLQVRLDLERTDDAARHDEAEGVNRIGRVGAQDHVARRGDRLRHVGKTLLGAQRRHDLGVRIEFHAEAARVVIGLGAAQARNASRGRIAMRARIAHHFAKLVHDRLRRRQVGVAHAEVDDVGAARAGAGLQPVDLLEHVGRKPTDLVKFFHIKSRTLGGLRSRRDIYRFGGRVEASVALDDLERISLLAHELQALAASLGRLDAADARRLPLLCCRSLASLAFFSASVSWAAAACGGTLRLGKVPVSAGPPVRPSPMGTRLSSVDSVAQPATASMAARATAGLTSRKKNPPIRYVMC